MLLSFAGELGALEEVVGQLVTRGLLKPVTLKALWLICSNAFDQLTHVSTTCIGLSTQFQHTNENASERYQGMHD